MAKRGPKPKPTHLKIVAGNPGGRPLNQAEPIVDEPLGPPPDDWAPDAKALWHEVVGNAPQQVLTRSDRHLIEVAVRLLAQIRSEPTVPTAVMTQFRACLSEMGMTPSARTRLSINQGTARNPFQDLEC